jgi:putative colanic acid biosynthesis UDP-glucose lipid carrier transferase
MNFVKHDFRARTSHTHRPLKGAAHRLFTKAISHRTIAPLAIVIDALIIFSMSILSGIVYHLETLGMPGHLAQFGGFAAIVAALFITIAKSHDLYKLSELLNFKLQIRKIAAIWIIVFLFLTAIGFMMKVGENFSRGATLSFVISGLAMLIVSRTVWRIYLADGLAVRGFSSRIVLITEQASSADPGLLKVLTHHGLQLAHHFVLPAARKDAPSRKKVIAQAISSIRGSNIEEIVVSADVEHWSELDTLLSELRVLPIPVSLVPAGPMSELFKLSSHTIGDTVTIELQRGPRTGVERSVKRTFDIAVAATGLVLFLPLLLTIALLIRLDSRGPIIFRQRRCGFNGRRFQIWKFRTMSVLEDGETITQAKPNDARITRIGNWLRQTSLDELPQLFNVIQGSMSIVGPRPHAVAHDTQFDKLVGNYAYRHHVKPGLTGWAQVNGFRGETRTIADIEQRVKFDLWYIDNWSLALDFKIMLMTAIEIMRGKNAY